MSVRLFFLLVSVLSVAACATMGPEGPPLAAVCTSLIPAQDSSLAAHPSLWTLDSAPPLSAEQERRLSDIRARPTTADVHLARLSPAADSLLQPETAIALTVSPGRSAIVRGETVTRRGPSDVSWSGLIQGEFGRVTLVLTTKGLTGTLQSLRNYASYKVEPIGGGLQAIACIDSSQYPPD